MANQQAPARPWFRSASMNRPPSPAPLAQAQPPAHQPRPPFVRPTLRPPSVAQPQAPAQPHAPPVAAAPPAHTASPSPRPPSPVAAPPPATTSVPSSPIIKVSASSLPTSPAPKPSPKSPVVPPVASSSSTPSSPNKKVLSASSLPGSPAHKVMSPPAPPSISATAAAATVNARAATPTSSPKIINPLAKTSPLSPKMEPVSSNPPSPLVLPPAQIKFEGKPETKIPSKSEQKTIIMQETFEEPKVIIPNTSNDKKGFYKTYSDSKDFGVRVITIAGENRGAIMELGHRGLLRDGKKSERNSNDEGINIKMEDKPDKMVRPLKTAFINSNVQGVNNSILLDSSFTHRDPGVHLSLSSKANGGRGAHLKDQNN
ncbi:vegetative cell wall protein gp1-like [Cornus florida]|uniref:vegetative cell wall protein gp1-like n=1 Tax=Cornus florida TaxID=4283 RepID=UPI00289BE285|nr:vegetative cell wall protein gp1-like [Cornus florida]